MLRDALAAGPGASDLLLPRLGLSALLPIPALAWLEAAGARIRLAHRVDRIEPGEAGDHRWRVDDDAFDARRRSRPARSRRPGWWRRTTPAWAARAAALRYEPIVTVYARAPDARLPEPMLILHADDARPAQFVFDRGRLGGPAGLLAFVVSGAEAWVARGLAATEAATLAQARAALAAHLRGPLVAVRTIVEKRATFRCTPQLDRPSAAVAPGLAAAGDYVDGPYPATLEGAVRSGAAAARALLSPLSSARIAACERPKTGPSPSRCSSAPSACSTCWPSHQEPVSLKAISEQSGLHPSTAHRILNDLTIGRYVDRPEAGSYRLGMRLLELGNLVKARLDVRDAALAPMRELHKLTHQPVNLSMRQGDEIVYVERTYSERSGMQVVRAIGGRAPLHLTSVGKLFLAQDDAQRVRAYATRTGLAGHTRNSITELTALERELSRVSPVRHRARRRGAGARRALHGRRHPRRPGQAGGRAVDLGTGRSAGGKLAGALAGDRGADLGGARAPRLTLGRPSGRRSQQRRLARPPARRHGAGADSVDPAAHPLGIADARVLAGRIEEHHDQVRPAILACITRQRPASEM